jgi:LuxR family maltose regulon positive regulatory protein
MYRGVTEGETNMHQSPLFLDQLLTTKFFVPAATHTLFARPRLLALLDAGLKGSLTLISASAGYGKTTLLSAWVRSLPKGNPLLAWISLDEGDNEPTRFWSYVFTALDNCQEGLCTSLLMLLQDQQPPSIEYLLTELIETLSRSKRQFLLVLDDYHLITEPSISASLRFLLEHLPPQLHVQISTRTDLPFSLAALRAHDQVVEIRTAQLRTTLEEASLFLGEVMGVTLANHEIELVEARTEGWLVGLQLIGLSRQTRATPTDLLAEASGSQDYILDYLTEEVLRQQEEALQSFLLRTSILQRLSAPLCDAVLEQTGSQQMLEQLEQANLFLVSLDEHRRWYRYHALFAEALRARLEQSSQEEVKVLHLRASAWYEQHSQTYEAVYHALQAKAWQRAADLIESVANTCRRSGEWRTVRRWVEQLPPAVVRARPVSVLPMPLL